MISIKNTSVAFIAILIIAWLVVLVTQVEAQTTDEQKQALIGEWRGTWLATTLDATLIIHEIDTEKAKARCTYTISGPGQKKYPVLADFTPGPNPKIEFKKEKNNYQFVLKKKILQGTFRGLGVEAAGHYESNTIKMEKYTKK